MNSSKPNLIFIAPSGGGKTTCCDYLADHHGFYSYHPYSWRKRQYEALYRLPAFYLDTIQGKADSAPGMTCTFQEMMVREYHFWAKIDPFFCSRNTSLELEPIIAKGQPICMQAIRNRAEVLEIQKLDIKYKLVELIGRGKPETSDEHYKWIQQSLAKHDNCDSFYVISNGEDTQLSDLFSVIDSLLVRADE